MTARSGKTEPTWIAQDGAIVYEDVDLSTTPAPTDPTEADPFTDLPEDVQARYAAWRRLFRKGEG